MLAAKPRSIEAPSLEEAQRDFERKIRERGELLLHYFARRVPDEHRVEDLYQETLMRAWASRPEHLEDDDRWARRCMTIARNLLVDDWRRARAERQRRERLRLRSKQDAQAANTALENLLEKEMAKEAEQVVKELPRIYEEALRLRAEGLSTKAMARAMNVEPQTAQSRLRRARKLAQERLKKRGY